MARLAPLIPAPIRPFAKKLRDIVRGPDQTPLNETLSAADCRVEFTLPVPSLLVERNGSVPLTIILRNLGNSLFSPYGSRPVSVSLKWLTARKVPLELPAVHIPLAAPIHPGQSQVLNAMLSAPDSLGHFLVELDLVQEGSSPFASFGSRSILAEVQVTGRNADDIDYHKAYATADLTKDFWTVVGPGTKEEFDRLGRGKLDTLKELGLTPDSRVLDVGCGTGQLAVPLEQYLSDSGCFTGTDIGPEAIAFCKEHYRRPNFRFFHNEMTGIPIPTGTQFDFITFFSVFTHTFPDETVLLLAEAKRLLAPNGKIIGDAFTSPVVERCSGNRGAMELNRDHLMRLVALTGLKVSVHASWPWQKYGTREVFVFTHGG